jgi:hypothetical protein
MTSLSRRNLLATAPAALALGAAGATAAAMPAADNPDRAFLELIARFDRLDEEAGTIGDRRMEIEREAEASVAGHDWSAFLDGHGGTLLQAVALSFNTKIEDRTPAADGLCEVMGEIRAKAEGRVAAIAAARKAAGDEALEAQEAEIFAQLDVLQAEIVAAHPVTIAGLAALARFASRNPGDLSQVFGTLADGLAGLVDQVSA